MEIDWFWLRVIIFIISLTIVAVVGKYLHYKWKQYRWLNGIEEEKTKRRRRSHLSTYFEIQQKAQEEIDKHEINCEMFRLMLEKGFIDKQIGSVCNYYYLNLIGAKKTETSIHSLDNCIVESHMIYNCPFCFAKLMIPVDTGEDPV